MALGMLQWKMINGPCQFVWTVKLSRFKVGHIHTNLFFWFGAKNSWVMLSCRNSVGKLWCSVEYCSLIHSIRYTSDMNISSFPNGSKHG